MNWLDIIVIAVLSVYTLFIVVPIFVLLFDGRDEKLYLYIYRFTPKEKISIIVPFRNEAGVILNCLKGIIEQEFPKELVEIILVDDNSEDDTKQLAESFLKEKQVTYKLINLKEKNLTGKKTAIEQAVLVASGSIIITRDADTYTKSNHWLMSIAYHFRNRTSDLLLAPVILSGSSFIQAFQQFENIAMTCAGYAFTKIKLPFVCSGANLAYRKDSFLKTNPYKENKHIASGDDMFLLQSFMKAQFSISASKNSDMIVYTNAVPNLLGIKSFINQRLRWASKVKSLKIKTAWGVASLLVATNLLLLIYVIVGLFSSANSKFCLFALLYKCVIDFLLLFLAAVMYKQKLNFAFYIPAFIANLFYVPFITIASIIVKPSWKGRKISG
ncbi:MAG TPA: glycosyltransferase [Bacteroidia bacterium]